MAEPHQNRVAPTSEIIATPLRGAWTGNRGCVHRGEEIVRRWASPHWLICSLNFKDWWHEQWVPNRLTWLYFHDEAVAFAAGHRPCALCRRPTYQLYRDGFDDRERRTFKELDRQLHHERLQEGNRERRLVPVSWSALPDGAFVIHDHRPALVHGDRVIAWSPTGYGEHVRRPRRGDAALLTPASSLRVLQAGYPIQIDPAISA